MKVPDVGFPLGTHPTIYEFYEWTRSVLNEGRYQMRVIDAPPDWTTNDGEILAVNDADSRQKSLYLFVTDRWYSVPLTQAGTGGTVPTGGIIPFGGPDTAVPSGWALCNGAAASRETYVQLFSVIGTTFGAGDGTTTFNLPDLRVKFPLGAYSTGAYALGAVGGSFLTVVTGTTDGPSGYTGAEPGPNALTTVHTHTFTGSGDGTNPYLALNYIIKL